MILRRAGVSDGVALVQDDLRDPASALADQGLGKVIDIAQPVMVLATLVLHFIPADQAREVIAGYAARLAPGSIIVVSVPRNEDAESFARVREVWHGELHNHTRAEVVLFFDRLRLVPPGIVLARGWHGEMPLADIPAAREIYVLGGAAWTAG